MSRSRKKPIVKDNANTGDYWRPIRREWKQKLKKNWDDPDLHLRTRREIHNDWDFWDWKWIIKEGEGFYFPTTKEDVEKAKRK